MKQRKILLQFIVLAIAAPVMFTSCQKDPVSGGNAGNGGDMAPATVNSSLPERVILDTAYGPNAKQKMDIYLPAGRTTRTRLLVLIHGGGWKAGDKAEMNYYKNLLRQAWPDAAIANINYRLASNNNNIHHTEIMNDISSAVQFLLNNRGSFVVSDTLGMIGASAGAQLAMLYTYAFNTDNKVRCVADFFAPAVINDWSWYNSFNLWVGVYVKDILKTYTGSYWNEELYKSVSPYTRATTTSRPTIIFHGTLDVIVPLYQSQWMAGRLNSLGVPYKYQEYPLEGHGFNATNTSDAIQKTVTFFKQYCN